MTSSSESRSTRAAGRPQTGAPQLDFLSVPIYPEKGKVEGASANLSRFAVGKPVVGEETFPSSCSTPEVEAFIKQSRRTASGRLGHYDGMTPERLEGLKKDKPPTASQAIDLDSLTLFREQK